MSLLDKLRELGISENLIKEIEKFRSQYPVDNEYESRIPVPTQFYYGSDVWEQAITAVLCGENLLLVGEKATGKNLSQKIWQVYLTDHAGMCHFT